MKRLVKVEEVDGEGLEGLMGEYVVLWCMNYIYSGKLVGVNDKFVKLEEAHVVFETGAFDATAFKDAQALPTDHYIMLTAVESFSTRGF